MKNQLIADFPQSHIIQNIEIIFYYSLLLLIFILS